MKNVFEELANLEKAVAKMREALESEMSDGREVYDEVDLGEAIQDNYGLRGGYHRRQTQGRYLVGRRACRHAVSEFCRYACRARRRLGLGNPHCKPSCRRQRSFLRVDAEPPGIRRESSVKLTWYNFSPSIICPVA